MDFIDNNEITMDYYKEYESRIDGYLSEEKLIETHQKLIGKTCKNDYYKIEDCGVEFIRKFLSRDKGRTFAYNYQEGAQKFIQSKYLSDYFKNSIKELLKYEILSNECINALNSDKTINEMTENEIKAIYSSIKEFYSKSNSTKANIASYFLTFLYKLSGEGVCSFIKNNVSNYDLANHILLTSGLSDRASYYSGRGVNYSDLNDKNLVAIFNKLVKINPNYAINFVEMVSKMKNLGATPFINTFKNFADNGFKVQYSDIEESNVSLDGLYDESRNTVAYLSIISTMSRRDDDYQIMASSQIKNLFILRVSPILMQINPNFIKQYNNLYESNYIPKRRK